MLVQKKLDLIQRVQYCSFASAPSKYKKVPYVTDSLYFDTNRADCVILFIVEVQKMEKGVFCHLQLYSLLTDCYHFLHQAKM